MPRDYIHLSINGKLHKINGAKAFLPLSDLLRYELQLTGTKVVCSEGDCGACSVMFRRFNSPTEKFQSLNSCISTSFLLDGCHIITVEGLANGESLTDVQESMVRNFGGQCGFCTPGFVMSITNLYEQKENPTEQNVKNYLTGNLCRCTGYTPIIQAALDVDAKKLRPLSEKYVFETLQKSIDEDLNRPIKIAIADKEFFAPTTFAMAAEYKRQHPRARIFSGATDIGVQINKGKDPGQHLMSLHLLRDLYDIAQEGEWVRVGAKVTLHTLQKFITDSAPEFAEFLNLFASPQIKSSATLVGNIANGSPIADTTPYLLTADAVVELLSVDGARSIPLTDFITGYKTFAMREDEFITHLRFKLFSGKFARFGIYKISQRRDLDISCVNSSFMFSLKSGRIAEARIALGGVGPRALRLFAVEKALAGQELNDALISKTLKLIAENIAPLSDVRGSSEYRAQMCQDLFARFAKEQLI